MNLIQYIDPEPKKDVGDLMNEYSERSLPDLDKENVQLKRRLRSQLSSLEVNVAAWKASPFGIISLLSASIIIGMADLPPDQQWILAIPVAAFTFFLILGLYCWRRSVKINNEMAETELRLELVNNTIQDRVTLLKANLKFLIEKISVIDPTRYNFIPFDENMGTRTEDIKDQDDLFTKAESQDLCHRFRSLMESIKELKEQKIELFKQGGSLYMEIQKKVIDASKKSGIDLGLGQNRVDVKHRTIAAIQLMNGNIESSYYYSARGLPSPEVIVTKFDHPSGNIFLSNEAQYQSFRDILIDRELIERATDFEEIRNRVANKQSDVKRRVSYILV